MANFLNNSEFIQLTEKSSDVQMLVNDYNTGFLTENELKFQCLEVYNQLVYDGSCDLGCSWTY